MQFRIVTFVVALLFGVIGGIVLGVERSLSKIHRYSGKMAGEQQATELVGTWLRLYVCLTSAVLLVLVVMACGLIAITGRLQQGFTFFG